LRRPPLFRESPLPLRGSAREVIGSGDCLRTGATAIICTATDLPDPLAIRERGSTLRRYA